MWLRDLYVCCNRFDFWVGLYDFHDVPMSDASIAADSQRCDWWPNAAYVSATSWAFGQYLDQALISIGSRKKEWSIESIFGRRFECCQAVLLIHFGVRCDYVCGLVVVVVDFFLTISIFLLYYTKRKWRIGWVADGISVGIIQWIVCRKINVHYFFRLLSCSLWWPWFRKIFLKTDFRFVRSDICEDVSKHCSDVHVWMRAHTKYFFYPFPQIWSW